MKIRVELEEEKDVWQVWVNSDLNEGRGFQYPSKTCEAEATAIRLSKRACVQGSNGLVKKTKAYKIYGNWHYPAKIELATRDDQKAEAILVEKRRLAKEKEAVLVKAKSLGLSEDEIKLLKGENNEN